MSGPDSTEPYFSLRDVSGASYEGYEPPAYLLALLPDKASRILDFGCGLGQLMHSLVARGYTQVTGADVEPQALQHVRQRGLQAEDATDFEAFVATHANAYDFIVLAHVLEHLPKERMVPMLQGLRRLLRPGGRMLLMVPNAQSPTGPYWRYEDFTHHWLFTTGSLRYVLRAAGFERLQFIDVDCTAGLGPVKAGLRRGLLRLYRARTALWNAATGSAYHAPSPQVFSYEIKALVSG